jgi:hypothetical protein
MDSCWLPSCTGQTKTVYILNLECALRSLYVQGLCADLRDTLCQDLWENLIGGNDSGVCTRHWSLAQEPARGHGFRGDFRGRLQGLPRKFSVSLCR